jgi:hypothetical protein
MLIAMLILATLFDYHATDFHAFTPLMLSRRCLRRRRLFHFLHLLFFADADAFFHAITDCHFHIFAAQARRALRALCADARYCRYAFADAACHGAICFDGALMPRCCHYATR